MSTELLRELTTLRQQVSQQAEVLAQVQQQLSIAQQNEHTLKESKYKLSLIFEHIPVAVIEWSPTFEVMDWNPAAERIFGYSRQEALGCHVAELIVPASARPHVDRLMETLIHHHGGIHSINENITKDGRIIVCEWHNAPMINAQGEVIGITSMTQDITDRQRMEQENRNQQHQLQAILDNIPQRVWLKDRHGCHKAVNEPFSRALNFSSDDLIGKTDFDLWPTDKAQSFWQEDVQIMASGQPYSLEEQITTADGVARWFSTTKTPIYDETGQAIGITGISTDITERRRAELAVQQANEELERRVEERTAELLQVVTQLQDEVAERQAAEAALRESEAYNRNLFEQSPIGLVLCRMDGQLVDINSAYADIIGRTVAETLTLTYWDITPRKYASQEQGVLQALADTGRYGPYEKEYIHKDGHLVPVQLSGLIVEKNGESFIWSSVEDISDRKEAEAELKQTRRFLESVLNNLPVGVVAKEAQDLRFVLCNPAAEDVLGVKREDLLGKSDYDFFPPEQADFFTHKDRAVLNSKQILDIPEELMQRQDGETRVLHTKKTAIVSAEGEPLYLLAITEDITERKQAEQALRYSEQRFRDVTEAAGEYIWELDANAIYTFVTDKAKSVKGFSPAQLLGHTPFEFMPDEDVEPVQAILHDACVRKGSFRLEHRDITPIGDIVWEEVSGTPLLNDAGEIIGFRGTGLSITERKQAELQLLQSEAQLRQQALDLEEMLRELQRTQSQLVQSEKMSSLGQLVAGVAHEINNPVNFIYGNLNHANAYTQDLLNLLSLYQEHYPNPVPAIQAEADAIDLDFLVADLPKLLTSMKVGADRIQKIVASLRTFSRMDEAEFKAVDIHEGIDSTLMILQNRLKARHDRPAVEVIKDYADLPLVECYAGQLNQVFMNILSNALDALDEHDAQRTVEEMQQHPSTIQIRTAVMGSSILIRVSDNGPGMPENVQRRLFDPFFTTKAVGKGTGMGLSISYQIVTEKHGGSLQCFSAPGQGSEFAIEIPLRQSTQNE